MLYLERLRSTLPLGDSIGRQTWFRTFPISQEFRTRIWLTPGDYHTVPPSPTGPWWVSDNGTGLATVYTGDGTPFNPLVSSGTPPLVVTIPPPAGSPAGTTAAPTGNVFNPTSDFAVPVPQGPASKPSIFIFATEDGTISGWNPNVSQTQAILAVDRSTVSQGGFTGAVYKGLATGQSNFNNFLYATNFRFGQVEQFDANLSSSILLPMRRWRAIVLLQDHQPNASHPSASKTLGATSLSPLLFRMRPIMMM